MVFGDGAWVVSPEDLTPAALVERTGSLLREHGRVKRALDMRIPALRTDAFAVGREVREVCGDSSCPVRAGPKSCHFSAQERLASMNLPLVGTAMLAFGNLAWGTLRRPMLGLGLLLALLPLLSLARRFQGDSPLFPSLETLAVLLVWCCVQVGKVARRDRWSSPAAASPARATGTLIAGLLFLAAGLASSLLSRNPELSLKILLAGGLIPLLAYSIAAESEPGWANLKPVVWGMIALALQVGVYTAFTFHQRQGAAGGGAHSTRGFTTRANSVNLFVVPSVAVSMVVPAIPLAAWALSFGRGARRGLLPAAVVVAVLAAVLLSMSRGSWVAAGVALVGSVPIFLRRVRLGSVLFVLGIVALLYSLGLLDIAREVFASRLGSSHAMHNVDVRQANFLLALRSPLPGTCYRRWTRASMPTSIRRFRRRPPHCFRHSGSPIVCCRP